MNGFIRKISAAALAVVVSVGAAVSASADSGVTAPNAAVVELDRLVGGSVGYNGYPDYGVCVLMENRTIKKNPLSVRSDETIYSDLVIPKGKKLTLKKGAVIDGNLYIEKGATVSVSGGVLTVNGNLICDGALNIGENAFMKLTENSRFVVNTSGSFRYNADGIGIFSGANYACFGKLSYKYLDEITADAIAAKPACVIAKDGESGRFSMITDEEQINKYVSMLRDYGYGNPGTEAANVYMIMGNGSRISVETASDRISSIAGVNVTRMIKLTDEQLDRKASIK